MFGTSVRGACCRAAKARTSRAFRRKAPSFSISGPSVTASGIGVLIRHQWCPRQKREHFRNVASSSGRAKAGHDPR
jgi:hypothetical protein